ncbi:MAG: bifunctional YncE family protein/alkaline phosphatase family protein [Cyclobacteriaceae bacterium]|nr:bifunctional YncE family protein/alkaline phosphatase family protein [Cyclobacteriaceae bacterium]
MKKVHFSPALAALLLVSAIFVTLCQPKKTESPWVAIPPAYVQYLTIDIDSQSVLPNGRIVAPAGKTIRTAPHPYGLTLSPDGNIAVTANSGTNPLSITIIRNILSENPEVRQVPPGANTDEGILASVFMGLAISPDNQMVYVSGGQENRIYVFSTMTGDKLDSIDCSFQDEETDYTHGYIGDLVLTADGSTIYAVDQLNFRVVMLDVADKKLLRSIPVGRYPFGIVLSPDEQKLYVANVGMYEYKPLPGLTEENIKEKGLKFPAFGYGTKEAEVGIKNDSTDIPGLGPQNAIEAFSVFTIDISTKDHPQVIAKNKTGHLVGSLVDGVPAVGGSSPNSLAATSQYVFVSNGNNDNISVIDIAQDSIVRHIFLKPDERLQAFRGVIPFGLDVSPDHSRLYVAEAGINAVAVIDIASMEVLGHIPTAWFPSRVKVSKDGKKLIVTSAKGFGSGPNGGTAFDKETRGSYIGNLMLGTVSVIDIPDTETLKTMTRKVVDNNFRFVKANDHFFENRKQNPIPIYPGEHESPIKHIVFISKENRTYDEVFGQLENAKGDASLARYGKTSVFYNRDRSDSVTGATVMPNHLKLAREFAFSDNFYVDSDHSADGHRWLVNTYPNEWVETTTSASYGGNRRFRPDSKAPGVYAMNGAAGAIYPEDYNEAGSMWDHLERHDVDFYNFGFSVMFEPASYEAAYKYEGIRLIANYPVPQPLMGRSSRSYPTYNMAIPDQFRIDQFIKEYNEKWSDSISMPSLMTVIIPNDHGAGERPEAGYPFRESYMADNDLALGRIVEFLSHTPYWKNMMIVITEDDSQNGVDHIDAHRSVLLVVSPWVKRNYASHMHYSFGSIFKTFWNVLSLPYLNQYDAAALDFGDFFTDQPDFTPYRALPVDERMFLPQKALDPFDEHFDWKALDESPELDNVQDFIEDSKERDEYRLENLE